MNIVFFGTPEFSTIILEKLCKAGLNPALVVTAPDKPVGRKQIFTPPPVKVVAQKNGIAVLQPKNINNVMPAISGIKPDLVIVVAYGQIFPKELLVIPKYGCLNLHFSLLPKYRGTFPIPYEILDGEKETGVTIVKMSEKVDQGEIVAQEKIPILPGDTTASLTLKLAQLGGDLLIKTIPLWVEGKIQPKPQGQSPTPYCKRLRKEDGKIDWTKPAEYIERQVRAFDPWPRTYAFFKGKALKILQAEVLSCENNKRPGEVFLTDNGKLAVGAGQNCLVVKKLQIEGGKAMLTEEFLRGRPNIVGMILG